MATGVHGQFKGCGAELSASPNSTFGAMFDPKGESTDKAASARISKTPWTPLNVFCIRSEGFQSLGLAWGSGVEERRALPVEVRCVCEGGTAQSRPVLDVGPGAFSAAAAHCPVTVSLRKSTALWSPAQPKARHCRSFKAARLPTVGKGMLNHFIAANPT